MSESAGDRALLADVLDGYVSRDGAIRYYGLDPMQLDAAIAQWGQP